MVWWEYPTNYSSGTAVDGVGKFFIKYPSHILNDYFGAGFILLLWISIFGISLSSGSRKAMFLASFISSIFAIWFWILGVLNPVIIFGLIILTIVGAIGSKEEGL